MFYDHTFANNMNGIYASEITENRLQVELSFEDWINSTAELMHPLEEKVAKRTQENANNDNSTHARDSKEDGPSSNETGAMRRLNRFGREFVCGRPLALETRKTICDLYRTGWKACEIANGLNVTHGCVSKIIKRYKMTGMVDAKKIGGSHPRKSLPNVVEAIVAIKSEQPTIRTWEIRDRLITDEICNANNLPTMSSINRIIRQNLGRDFSRRKKLYTPTSNQQNDCEQVSDNVDMFNEYNSVEFPSDNFDMDQMPSNAIEISGLRKDCFTTFFSTAFGERSNSSFGHSRMFPDLE